MNEADINLAGFSFSVKDVERFYSKVNKDGPLPDQSKPFYVGLGRCWNWTGGVGDDGYGDFSINRKSCRGHRFSFWLHNKRFPGEMCVLHKCDNPSCVNPAHLFLGTNRDNIDDSVSKGRRANLEYQRGPHVGTMSGIKHPNVKLSEGDVLEIRRIGKTETAGTIASRFGVDVSNVSLILNGKRWKHLLNKPASELAPTG